MTKENISVENTNKKTETLEKTLCEFDIFCNETKNQIESIIKLWSIFSIRDLIIQYINFIEDSRISLVISKWVKNYNLLIDDKILQKYYTWFNNLLNIFFENNEIKEKILKFKKIKVLIIEVCSDFLNYNLLSQFIINQKKIENSIEIPDLSNKDTENPFNEDLLTYDPEEEEMAKICPYDN